MVNFGSLATPQSSFPNLLCPSDIVDRLRWHAERDRTQSQSIKVILVRHARSTYNHQGRYQGCSDESVLTEQGQQDAYRTGVALQAIKIDAIYASPLQRVQQTVTQIVNVRKESAKNVPPVLVTDNLKEINISLWQGLTYQYVQENFARPYFDWKNSPEKFKLINSTTKQETFPILDLDRQVKEFWQEILPRHQGKTILVVSHGGTNRALINTALGIKPINFHFLQQSNCGISILEFPQNQLCQANLLALNLTAHIGKALPKLKEGKQGLRLLLLSGDNSQEQFQQLAEFWQQESIDFILSDCFESSAPFIQSLCSNRSQLFYLQVPTEGILEVWQQQILSGKIGNSLTNKQPLITGLIIVDRELLKQLLAQVSSSYSQVFTHNLLTIIHYPDLDRHPIFQGITAMTQHQASKS